jgi:DNA polymerase I-like protein with 3'-5' exonuclease and polymerase domains
MYAIEKRGILVDLAELGRLRTHILTTLRDACIRISTAIGRPTVVSKEMGKGIKNVIVLQSVPNIIEILEARGLKIPKDRETGKKSTKEDVLFKMWAESGDPILKDILEVRENSKMLGTYVNAQLSHSTLYHSFIVANTVSGRRASKINFCGLGMNGQNLPKHSDLAKIYRKCLVARPGKIFLNADQCTAEDWIVHGIIADVGGIMTGINELRAGVDRHAKLASIVFGKPLNEVGKGTIERFLGKKTRHSGNYLTGGNTMSNSCAKEGYNIPAKTCDVLLKGFYAAEPGIRGVFHAYVEETLSKSKTLTTPVGRIRQFFGLRPFGDNSKTFREAYSYIPQSTVGDNTGLAILDLGRAGYDSIVSESHDSIIQEIDDDPSTIWSYILATQRAFDREFTFPVTGFKLKIPIEVELGYNLGEMIAAKTLTEQSVKEAHEKCSQYRTI